MPAAVEHDRMIAVDPSERDLVDRCCRGDRAAWDEFVARFYEIARAAARQTLLRSTRSAPSEDIENIAQTVFVSLVEEDHRRLKQYAGRCPLRSWLWSVTIRNTLNYLRGESLRRGRSLDAEPLLVPESGGRDAPGVATAEQLKKLESYFAKLNPKERLALRLHYTDGLSQKQVAKILNVAENTIGALISRARSKLQEMAASDSTVSDSGVS
jgi:RNA polymerase sigma-70 factor (ECF subfamily)